MEYNNNDNKNEIPFDAVKFACELQFEGSKIQCDDTHSSFRKMELPDFYDEEKFKSGQEFFHRNIFSMFYAKFLGLICDLAFPDGQAVLSFTKQSSEPEKAFGRYLSTILHMCTWYTSDLKSGSESWESLTKVRSYHNLTSKACSSKGIVPITQYGMGMAQFGFMGYILAKPKAIGMHYIDDKDLEGFVHLWRVIGYLLGMEDRFNICRESVEETVLICNEINEKILRPQILTWNSQFLSMTKTLTSGMWCAVPVINYTVWLRFVYEFVEDEETVRRAPVPNQVQMNYFETFVYYFVLITLYLLKFESFRTFQKYNMYFMLYVVERFPFLAYYKFGKIKFHFRT